MPVETLPMAHGPDPVVRADARRQLHNAVHWLARIVHSYVEPTPDHHPVVLHYDRVHRCLETAKFENETSVALHLPTLRLQFRERGVPVPHVLDLEEHTPAHVEAWILVELLHRGIDRERFSKQLPYHASDVMTGDSVEFAPSAVAGELERLITLIDTTAVVLGGLAGRADEPILCWPADLQFGVEFGPAPALRVALSTGDEHRTEPYFLVAPLRNGTIDMPRSDAIVTSSQITSEKLDRASLEAAINAAVTAARRRLTS